MYFGQYNHQLDDKDRFRVPAKFKEKLGEKIYLTRGSMGCINVFSEEDFVALREEMKKIPPLSNPKAQKMLRDFHANTDDPEGDNQGRFKLADHLKQWAQIVKNLVFVGVGQRIEIWSEEGWKKYNAENPVTPENFDEVLEALSEYGI